MIESEDSERGADARRQVGAWFDAHVNTIHRYIARRAGDDVAVDVTAETFRVALEQFDRFDTGRGDERSWLYGIATNLLRHHWRTEQRLTRTHLRFGETTRVPGDPLVAVEARVDAERDAERVLDAIDRLDPDDRDLLVLVAWEHLSSAEISAVLDVPASTIRARLRRIRSQLRSDQGGST
ncbi:MAG: RNA polymerase sigma factor [Ilumatobacter fluminis]|uniref:RNA polymerase sigma factor n=1 Tax=Ilumatobacter fluminis TaxID=467091 RepID=UPI0032EBF6E9